MNERLKNVASKRIRACRGQIEFALEKAGEGNPFAAESDLDRRRQRLQRKKNLNARQAELISEEVEVQSRAAKEMAPPSGRSRAAAAETIQPPQAPAVGPAARRAVPAADGREKIWGDTVDFVNVAFLEKGASVARAVGRVAYKNGRPQGSGVLIGEGLFLTNHHVIENQRHADQFLLELDYELDLYGRPRSVTRYTFDASYFVTDPVSGLDFTILGVGPAVDGDAPLDHFGFATLSDARDKHMIGEFANIVQHPNGRFKEVVLRENQLVNRFEDALHYVADTEPGSSGSPVFNSEWQMIALHHWGSPWIDVLPDAEPKDFEINEGIRISSIVRKLRSGLRRMNPDMRARINAVLRQDAGAWKRPVDEETSARSYGRGNSKTDVRVDPDGRVTWSIPVELSVRLPHLAAPAEPPVSEPRPTAASTLTEAEELEDFSNRSGYMPDFLEGFRIPLPELGDDIAEDAARKLEVAPGENPNELKYHHFSVVMNKRRKLAFFTACNIDGESAKSVRRRDKRITDLSPDDSGLREAVALLDDAEADSWSNDHRLDKDDYSGVEIYENQNVPGFPNKRSAARIARMFQKGHLVRRIDPAWGNDDDIVLEAELDTFYYTNAAPQVGFFNQGTADEDQPGTGKGNLWRAAENYVLRNAVAENQRVISFTGPIFRDDDRDYRNIQIPGSFFKVTVWTENGELKSLALIVDQRQVFDAWPENFGSPEFAATATEAEAFLDEDELDRVQDFLSTVAEVEALTTLDFGEAVRNADVHSGEQTRPIHGEEGDPEIIPTSGRRRRKSAVRKSTKRAGAAKRKASAEPIGEPDDLTRINGLGPALEKRLHEEGIHYFHQIAAWSEAQAEEIEERIRARGSVLNDDWVGQATELMAE
ncbi:MAG: DNA/RNA non-specific endonuclease [Pseudomonadota bacterium]